MLEGFIRGTLGVQIIVILVALVVLSYQFGRPSRGSGRGAQPETEEPEAGGVSRGD
jgi:hypothetical protein